MAENNVEFTFDTSGFESAIFKMSEGINLFKNDVMTQMQKTNDGFQKNIIGGVFKAGIYIEVFKKILGIIGNMTIGFFDKFKEFVPEFGKAFSVAKDIIFKNLFYPLRQVLLPYLQKMLDWVTANRKLFVQWGGVLVNVFKLIKQAFESFWHVIKPVAEVITNMIKRIFGDTSKTIIETLNVLLFKVASVLIAIELLLTPVFQKIADSMVWIGGKIGIITDKFIELGKAIFDLGSSAIKTSFHFLEGLIEGLFGKMESKNWTKLGSDITKIFKQSFGSIKDSIKSFVDGLIIMIKGLTFIFDFIDRLQTKGFKATFSDKGFQKQLKEFTSNWRETLNPDTLIKSALGIDYDKKAAESKQLDKAIQASKYVNPVIKMMHNTEASNSNTTNSRNVNINMGGIAIYPVNGDINTGIDNFVKTLRTKLLDEQLREGGNF